MNFFKNNNLDDRLPSFKMEQMMEAAKKNKISIILVSFILFVIASFAILFYGMGQQEKAQKNLFIEEKAQLTDMTAYLDEIGKVVSVNQEHLAHSMLFQTDTEQTLQAYQEYLLLLENDLMRIDNILQNHTNTESIVNSEIVLSFTKLSECHQEIKSQLISIHGGIAEMLSVVRAESEEHFSTTLEKLTKLQKELAKTQDDTKNYYDNLLEVLAVLEENNVKQNKELISQLLLAQTAIEELLEINFNSLQLKLEENYLSLMQEMENLHNQVENAHLSITELLTLMEETDQNRQKEIGAAFASVNSSIDLIRTEYNSVHANLENLIQTIQETQIASYEETLSVLSEVETNLEKISLENLEQLNNSLQVIEENFSSSLTAMQNNIHKNFSDLNTEISSNLFQTNSDITNKLELINSEISNQHQELNNNISNQYEQISNTINNSSGEQQESLNNLMNYLEQKFGQVFTSVSNGKKKVVSALLTKGVDINEDATFAQICNAILSIEQEIKLGVEQIPGKITYDYHYHVDGKGKELHAEICGISQKGGCFSNPVYHAHKTAAGIIGNGNVYSSTMPGGCFTIAAGHTHDVVTACSKTPVYNHACDSGCGSYQYEYCDRCDYCIMASCGGCKLGTAYYHSNNKVLAGYNYTCGSPTNTYTTGCGKTTNTIVAYQPGCGLSDGQIIGATIVYDQMQ